MRHFFISPTIAPSSTVFLLEHCFNLRLEHARCQRPKGFESARTKSSDEILDLVSRVAKIEGKANNIRGQLFEFIVGHIVFHMNPGLLELGKVVCTDDGKKAEIDVFSGAGFEKIDFYECKGYSQSSKISLTEIETWFNKISIIYAWCKRNPDHANKSLVFNFWTASDFEADAKVRLEERQKITQKYKICWKNGTEVIEFAKNKRLESIVKVLREHYVKDVI